MYSLNQNGYWFIWNGEDHLSSIPKFDSGYSYFHKCIIHFSSNLKTTMEAGMYVIMFFTYTYLKVSKLAAVCDHYVNDCIIIIACNLRYPVKNDLTSNKKFPFNIKQSFLNLPAGSVGNYFVLLVTARYFVRPRTYLRAPCMHTHVAVLYDCCSILHGFSETRHIVASSYIYI